MEHYNARNNPAHEQFVDIIRQSTSRAVTNGDDHGADFARTVAEFNEKIEALHGIQWSEHIYNIIATSSQCPNNCRYCYMKKIKTRFFKTPAPSDIEDGTVPIAVANRTRVNKKWTTCNRLTQTAVSAKLIMFPSSHDIVPELLDDYLSVALKILNAGHDLMIVSKPRMDCFARIAEVLEPFKEHIIYRLTITSDRQDILSFWEPHAPTFAERLEVLRMLFAHGCITSVSMEPILSDPIPLIDKIMPFVSETIWVGAMTGLSEDLAGANDEYMRLRELYSVRAMRALALEWHHDPANPIGAKMRWKSKMMNAIVQSL